MKKSKITTLVLSMLLCVVLSAGILTGCGKKKPKEFDTTESVNLKMAVFHDNNSYISYNQTREYVAADGSTYRTGDIKPVWKELSKRLNFTITDISYSNTYANQSTQWQSMAASSYAGFDIITGAANDINTEATKNGTFVDIAQYLDRMPNLKGFIQKNDIVKKSVYVGDKMYYAPYFDGYDDLERMFMMRVDWVQKLLDGPTAPSYDTESILETVAYTKFMPASMSNQKFTIVKADGSGTQEITKNYSANIIDTQNALATKNGSALTTALRSYIDTTYGSTYGNNRSQLFVGQNAAYDPDELVALLRCVKTNPALLTGDARKNIVPFYPRNQTADRVMDLARLAEIWGSRGLDARNNFLYIDAEGNLQDTRIQSSTLDSMERINQLYKEKLVLQNFNDVKAVEGDAYTGDSTFRGRLNKQNRGFMTYDYNQTTTVVNTLDSEITGFNLTPVLPPFTDWGYKSGANVKYERFTDSWRSVKPNGWAIRSGISQASLERSLKLFDYLYSEEGNKLMSYGPEQWIDGTISYNGKQVPKLSATALAELKEYASGNYTNYYRRFLGGTFPIGYIKEQGMEYQCVNAKGQVGLDYILKAIQLGTVKHTVVNTSEAKGDKFLYTVPTALPLTQEQQALLTDNCSQLRTQFNIESSNGNSGNKISENYFITLMLNGFASKDKAAVMTEIKDTLKCGVWIDVNRDAYNTIK